MFNKKVGACTYTYALHTAIVIQSRSGLCSFLVVCIHPVKLVFLIHVTLMRLNENKGVRKGCVRLVHKFGPLKYWQYFKLVFS